MFRRQFLIGIGATLVAAGCGGPPTSPGSINPPPTPQPQPPPPSPVVSPTLSVTRILAFGDSITAGTTSPSLLTQLALDAGLSQSYPFKLQTLVTARYTSQSVAVFNAGIAGRTAVEDRSRLGRSLNEAMPDLLLLIEGANDLNQAGLNNPLVDAALAAMEDMVRDARRRGVQVMLGTLPAQRPPKGNAGAYLARYNDGLKMMAAKKDAILVDVNRLLPESFVGQDGLHPSEAGYQRMAEIFLDAIRQRFEVIPSTGQP